MRPMAYSRNKYSAELYKSVRETVGDSSTLKYYYVGNISLTAGLDQTGKMIINTDENLSIGWIISKIKDASGNLIMDETSWNILSVQPVLNAFNTIQTYRIISTKFAGEL